MRKLLMMLFAVATLSLPASLSSCSSDDSEDSIENSIRNADDLFKAIDKALKNSRAKSYEAYPYKVTRLGNYVVVKIAYGDDDYHTLLSALKSHYGSKVDDIFINKGGTITIEVK